VRMFEQTGGGVGVIDFDNDGWPDLYLTQGAKWISDQEQCTPQSTLRDSLFRNLGGKSFKEVALQAGIAEFEFSQGISVGDINNDGFEDLYVGNIGLSRLFINNGDGTFSDQSQAIGQQQPVWTTSTVLVDLNLDGLTDIFQLNYLQGPGVFTRICNGKGCSPSVFEGCPNQCWLNAGDGGFVKVEAADGDSMSSKSLGAVALIIEGNKFPSLFIANDQVPNFLLSVVDKTAGAFELTDESLERGLALSSDGLAFACMGIAADDIDNNGTVDLLVTNFADEPNSVYMQDGAGLFFDGTTASGMQLSSYPYVGWGTQFIDVDRDGFSDAVVAYGHIDDYRTEGKGYELAPQLYRNVGAGRFELVTPEKAGEFFQKMYLARSVAKLDWNKDGLMDFAVSNINSPACLVSNSSQQAGNYLNLNLIGTSSARQPIGTQVTVKTSSAQWKKQLTGGDGFQCSNQRMLQFGLGASEQIERLEVVWPSGTIETFEMPPLNSQLLLVEGQSQFWVVSPTP
jgi:ASPIC and UnbV/FG-GAP-like repeat